jgi:hypothetical protein
MCIDDEMDALGGVLWKTHIPVGRSVGVYMYGITTPRITLILS